MPAQPQTIRDLEKSPQNLQVQPGVTKNSTKYLVLEAIIEVLRTYHLHVEEKTRMAEEERGRARQRRSHRHHHNRRRGDKDQDYDHVISDPKVQLNQDPRYMMSGGGGPPREDAPPGERGHVRKVEPGGHNNKQHSRHHGKQKRSPPLGAHPTYKPKLGLTLGFGTYVKRRIKYEAERRAKDGTSPKRKAGQDARKKAKPTDNVDTIDRSPSFVNDDEGYQRVYELVANRNSDGEHTPRADTPMYEANSQSHAVEERERQQATEGGIGQGVSNSNSADVAMKVSDYLPTSRNSVAGRSIVRSALSRVSSISTAPQRTQNHVVCDSHSKSSSISSPHTSPSLNRVGAKVRQHAQNGGGLWGKSTWNWGDVGVEFPQGCSREVRTSSRPRTCQPRASSRGLKQTWGEKNRPYP